MAHPSAPDAARDSGSGSTAGSIPPAGTAGPVAPAGTRGSAAPAGKGGSGETAGEGEPTQVGPYRLVRRLGAGGMGTVYLGENEAGGEVAVKLIRSDLARLAEFRVRLKQEADNARRVARFCTAAVLDVDITGDQPYLVTEFVDGPTLAEAVARRGPLTPAELHQLAVSITTALMAIHHAGIVHRDLKPSNILLSRLGPKVIDFGIARALDTSRFGPESGTDRHLGTPAFMAPEQARGEKITSAADVFAWGGVLIYAGTGRFPFGGGEAAGLLYRTVNDPPNLDGLDDSLRPLVSDAMRKVAALRPRAEDLYTRLLDLRVDMPVRARALSEVTALIRPLDTPPPATGGSVVDGAEGGAAGPITPVTGHRPTAPPPPTAASGWTGSGWTGSGGSGSSGSGGTGGAVGGSPGLASGSPRTSDRAGEDSGGLGEAAPSGEFPAWKSADEWEMRRRPDDGLLTVWPERNAARHDRWYRSHPQSSAPAPASPSHPSDISDAPTGLVPDSQRPGRRATNQPPGGTDQPPGARPERPPGSRPEQPGGAPPSGHRRRGRTWTAVAILAVLAVLGGVVALLANRNNSANEASNVPAAVADQALQRRNDDPALARQLALAAYRTAPDQPRTRAAVIALFGRDLNPVTVDAGRGEILSVAVTQDGRHVATGSKSGAITVWEVTDRTRLSELDTVTTSGWVNTLAFNRGGDLLVSGSSDGRVRLWNVADPKTISRWPAPPKLHTDAVRTIAFSTDGNTLATSGADGTLLLWNVTDFAKLTTRSRNDAAAGGVRALAYSPDKRTLAVAGEDGSIRLWDIRDAAHPVAGEKLSGHSRAVRALAFSPDGASLISGGVDSTMRVWDVHDPAHPSQQAVRRGAFGSIVAVTTGDGALVVTGSEDDTVRLFGIADPRQPNPLAEWRVHTQPVTSVGLVGTTGVVLSAGYDGTMRLWDADPAGLASAACANAANRISPQTWSEYFGSLDYRQPCT